MKLLPLRTFLKRNCFDENDHLFQGFREQHQRRPASTSGASVAASSSGYPGESIAMSRFDRRESTGDDDVTDNPEHEDTFDETSLHND